PPRGAQRVGVGGGRPCRPTTHTLSPPPIQSIEASPIPTTIHRQSSWANFAIEAEMSLPYRKVSPYPSSEARSKNSKPLSRSLGVSRRAMGRGKIGRGRRERRAVRLWVIRVLAVL